MNDLLRRILLSIALMPLGMSIYIALFIALEGPLQEFFAFVWTGIFTWAFVVCYWLVVWRELVRWSPRRKMLTGLMIPVSAAISAVVGAFIGNLGRPPGLEFAAILSAILGIPLWLVATSFIWRETPDERTERLQVAVGKALFCPKCGYNMTGLYEARCPECGERFTLDQLLAAQQRNTAADLMAPIPNSKDGKSNLTA